jgi:tRNA (cytidine/uridine-2'-O-)-methyltransferase
MFNIVLVAPEIPPNTGNVIRLAANTGCALHLVGPLGFEMEDRLLRRAGLDYHEYAAVQQHASWQTWLAGIEAPAGAKPRLIAFTTHGARALAQTHFHSGDWLVFGSESAGLPPALRERLAPEQLVRLPMRPGQRSLNLSNAVAVVVYEAWRQNGYAGAI